MAVTIEIDHARTRARAAASAGQPVVQHMNFYGSAEPAQVKRAAAAGARSVLGVANGARRYG